MVYMPYILEPEPGDILERYCAYSDDLVGVFVVILPRCPDRRDLMKTFCLWNREFGYRHSKLEHRKGGDTVNLHRVKLIGKCDLEGYGGIHYYKIRGK